MGSRYNKQYEKKDYCERCGKIPTLDFHLQEDHIIPRAVGGTDDVDNLQTLCLECHSEKTRLEDMPLIREYKKALKATTPPKKIPKRTYRTQIIETGSRVSATTGISRAQVPKKNHEYVNPNGELTRLFNIRMPADLRTRFRKYADSRNLSAGEILKKYIEYLLECEETPTYDKHSRIYEITVPSDWLL